MPLMNKVIGFLFGISILGIIIFQLVDLYWYIFKNIVPMEWAVT